jgi:adenosylhomocysteine nucleosidase
MTKLGIVCGLAFETKVLTRAIRELNPVHAPILACSGPGPDRARAAAERLAEQGVGALLSFGIAGGLDPDLKTGVVVIPTQMVGDKQLPCDELWASRLCEAVNNHTDTKYAPLAGVQEVLATPARKTSLFQETGAAAADMESYGIAEAAAAKNIPFAALRVICDTADETIPPIAIAAMGDDGYTKVGSTMAQAVAHPSQIPDLMRLGRRTAQAHNVLEKLASFGVPRLFCASS